MKGKKPIRSRIRQAFLAVATAIVGLGGGAGIATLNNSEKDAAATNPITTTFTPYGMQDAPTFNFGFNYADYGGQLIDAADRGDVFSVYSLLGNPIEQTDKEFAMEIAAYRGHVPIVDALLQDGVQPSSSEWAAFTAAVHGGHADLADRLATLSPPSEQVLGEGLILAVQTDNLAVATVLVKKHRADVSYQNDIALLGAAENGNPDMVQLILQQQKVTIVPSYKPFYEFDKYNGSFYDEHIPPFRGTMHMDHGYFDPEHNFHTPRYSEIFSRAAANVNAGQSAALRAAVNNGHLQVASLLLEAGADANAKNGEALMTAVQSGDAPMVQLLLKHKANPDIQNGAIRNFVEKAGDPVMQSLFSRGGTTGPFPVYAP